MTPSLIRFGVPPCWRAYFLLLRQKKVAKEKATPGAAPATPVPCATRNAGRLAKLACGSDNASRLPPAFLRCSAPSKGTRKAPSLNRSSKILHFHGQPEKTAKNKIRQLGAYPQPPSLPRRRESIPCLDSRLRGNNGATVWPRDGFPGPLGGAEQRRKTGGSRRGLFEGQSPEFRSRPAFRVAQGTGAAGTDPGSPSFCLLFLGEARKSETPRKGGTQSLSGTLRQLSIKP